MNRRSAGSAKCTASTPALRSRRAVHLTVVGVGALGSELCLRIAEAGRREGGVGWPIAQVCLVDPDRVERRNLALSRLFLAAGGVGRTKAGVAAQWLNREGRVRWRAIPLEIADVGWGVLRRTDLLVSCVDSAMGRSEIALVARRLGLPMLDGAVSAQEDPHGRVSWFPSDPMTACYLCGVAGAARADILAYGFSPTLGCAVPRQGEPLSESPTAAPAVRETAATMLRAILRFAGNCQDPQEASAEQLTAKDGRAGEWTRERLTLPRGARCPWHEGIGEPLVALDHRRPFRDGLPPDEGVGGGWRIQLAWPVCLEARCLACGLRQATRQRLAKVRRRGQCAGCGLVGTLEALRSIGSIGASDEAAGKTPRQLGLPGRHLYRLRRTMAMAGEEEN